MFQFVIGLGVPVDLKEASVTVGTVIKFQYDLPTNSTEYTSRIYGFAETVSRDMDNDNNELEEKENAENNNIDNTKNSRKISEIDEINEEDNSTLVDITFDQRRKRSIQYSEGGEINTVDSTEIHTELPLQEAIRRQEEIDNNNVEAQEVPQRMNRWDFYKIIEHMVERY